MRGGKYESFDAASDGHLSPVRIGPEYKPERIFQHQAEAEGEQQRGDMPLAGVEDALDQAAFDDIAHRQHE